MEQLFTIEGVVRRTREVSRQRFDREQSFLDEMFFWYTVRKRSPRFYVCGAGYVSLTDYVRCFG